MARHCAQRNVRLRFGQAIFIIVFISDESDAKFALLQGRERTVEHDPMWQAVRGIERRLHTIKRANTGLDHAARLVAFLGGKREG